MVISAWDQSILSLPVSPRNESIPQSAPHFTVVRMVQWNSSITDTIENQQFAIIARCSTVATSIRISGRGGSSGHLTKIWVCLSTSVPFWMKYWISKMFHSHNVYLWMIWKFFSTTELPVFTILYYLQDHRQYNNYSTINICPSKCLKVLMDKVIFCEYRCLTLCED